MGRRRAPVEGGATVTLPLSSKRVRVSLLPLAEEGIHVTGHSDAAHKSKVLKSGECFRML